MPGTRGGTQSAAKCRLSTPAQRTSVTTREGPIFSGSTRSTPCGP